MEHDWIPWEETIRPTLEIIEKKEQFMKTIRYSYHDLENYLLIEIFNKPFVIQDGKKKAKADINMEYRFVENIFPYSIPDGTKHYVLWYNFKSDFLNDYLINTHINISIVKLLNNLSKTSYGNDDFEFVWYENPKKTINVFHHVQVFWRLKKSKL